MPADLTPQFPLPPAPSDNALRWVVCLCADWCGVCRDYRAVFDSAAQAHPELRFIWLDIEDHAALLGDAEVETFPTLLMADEQAIRFAGPLGPQSGTLLRLIAALQADPASRRTVNPVFDPLMAMLRARPEAA